jgi:GH15 family glucan-1,4-alpha-glucosidase
MQGTNYPPISAYGVIGNLRTAALIGLDGSIDWCCFPGLDGPSAFAALLDHRRGGRFFIRPAGRWTSRQCYLHRTNILETIFETAGGRLILTDWMPLSGDLNGSGGSRTAPRIHRRIRAEAGPIDVHLWWAPRLNYAQGKTVIRHIQGGFEAEQDGDRLVLNASFSGAAIREDEDGFAVEARFAVTQDQPRLVTTHFGTLDAPLDWEATFSTLDETARLWRRWLDKPGAEEIRQAAVGDTEMLARSELVLKLLTHGDSGAVAAAVTTSLPEVIGGERNWDYRHAWIRDASQTVESFLTYCHPQEAVDFLHFMQRSIQPRLDQGKSVGIVYGIDGRAELPQWELEHLEGYRQSKPVHIGNQAYQQTQHDSYGEILHSAYELARRGERLSDRLKAFLANLADLTCDQWETPDHGIWEMPGAPRHFVYTKTLCWVALDRAIRLGAEYGLKGNVARWRKERDRVAEEVQRCGFNAKLNAFVQHYDSEHLDAANLLLSMHELIPFEDPRMQGTIDQTIASLSENKLVYRYRADDGLPGKEGAFGICGFWLADALAFSGRLDEAHQYFDAMAAQANHLGLFSEQVDPGGGAALGNFPQGLTHIGFLDSAFHLAYAVNKDLPGRPPVGAKEHRRPGKLSQS